MLYKTTGGSRRELLAVTSLLVCDHMEQLKKNTLENLHFQHHGTIFWTILYGPVHWWRNLTSSRWKFGIINPYLIAILERRLTRMVVMVTLLLLLSPFNVGYFSRMEQILNITFISRWSCRFPRRSLYHQLYSATCTPYWSIIWKTAEMRPPPDKVHASYSGSGGRRLSVREKSWINILSVHIDQLINQPINLSNAINQLKQPYLSIKKPSNHPSNQSSIQSVNQPDNLSIK